MRIGNMRIQERRKQKQLELSWWYEWWILKIFPDEELDIKNIVAMLSRIKQ